MLEALIVIAVCTIAAVSTYKHHSGDKTTAFKEACVFAGLAGAMFTGAGAIAAIDQNELWNNWLTTSLIVVAVAAVLHYTVNQFSGHRSA